MKITQTRYSKFYQKILYIKDIIDELSKYDENTEVFVNDDEGHERICIKFDVLKDKYFLHGKVQPIVIRLIGSLNNLQR